MSEPPNPGKKVEVEVKVVKLELAPDLPLPLGDVMARMSLTPYTLNPLQGYLNHTKSPPPRILQ
jgi:hypothetical protein